VFENISHEHSIALDSIIKARHSVRSFSPIPPSRETVCMIIQAGLLAPFAAAAVAGKAGFRKVFVIESSSSASEAAMNLLKNRIANMADEFERKVGAVPFVVNLKRIVQQGLPGIGDAPYYIVVGEQKGIPSVAPQSLSYCLQNMWLKATSLRIGMRLVSVTMQMENDPDFFDLLGIPCGKYALDGCALGYPSDDFQPLPVEYPALSQSVNGLCG
jgi:nitroreductase